MPATRISKSRTGPTGSGGHSSSSLTSWESTFHSTSSGPEIWRQTSRCNGTCTWPTPTPSQSSSTWTSRKFACPLNGLLVGEPSWTDWRPQQFPNKLLVVLIPRTVPPHASTPHCKAAPDILPRVFRCARERSLHALFAAWHNCAQEDTRETATVVVSSERPRLYHRRGRARRAAEHERLSASDTRLRAPGISLRRRDTARPVLPACAADHWTGLHRAAPVGFWLCPPRRRRQSAPRVS